MAELGSFLNVLGTIVSYLDDKGRASLRLVSKQVCNVINSNVRGLTADLGDDDYEDFNLSLLVSKLPSLESICVQNKSWNTLKMSEVLEAARDARKLPKLDLYICDDGAGLDKALAGIRQRHWPLPKSLQLKNDNYYHHLTLNAKTLKGLLCLSSLTELGLEYKKINKDAASLIKPGSWPLLRVLDFILTHTWGSKPPLDIMGSLIHLTGLEELNLPMSTTAKAFAGIPQGSWPQLTKLHLHFSMKGTKDEKAAAVRNLLALTALKNLTIKQCGLSGVSFGQIKQGDWPHLEVLILAGNDFGVEAGDDSVEAMKGLLNITSLQKLDMNQCKLYVEAVSQIKPGDWPLLQELDMQGSNFLEDPVAAIKGLLRLANLKTLDASECCFSAEALCQIKSGDWPSLIAWKGVPST